VDQLFQKTAFLDHCKKSGGMEYEDGGIKIQRPLAISEHSSITQHSTGYEPTNLAVNDVMQPAIYGWADFSAPVLITKKEELENQSEKAIVKIVEARMRNVMGMFRRDINRQILAGVGGSSLSLLNTLNGEYIAPPNTGFFEHGVADATGQQNTIGGVQKNVVDVTGWYNRFFNAGGAFSTNGIRGMQQLYTETNSRAPDGQIDCVIMSESGFANYKRALFTQERWVDEKALDGGRMALLFAGAPCEQDVAMPDATINNSNLAATAYLINFGGVKLITHKDADFSVSPFEHITGTTARAATVYWKGQLVADHLGSQGVLVNGDAY